MIEYSLRDARHSEVNLAAGANARQAGTSFTKLFYERIGHLRTKDVSITVDIRLNEDDKVITKGPFNLKMPIKLSKDDRYKFILYTLLDSGFRPQSGEYISYLGGSITSLKRIDLKM